MSESRQYCKEGLLRKFALGRSFVFGRKSWKDRWIRADASVLTYHKERSDPAPIYSIPLGPRKLNLCAACEKKDDIDKELFRRAVLPLTCQQCIGANMECGHPVRPTRLVTNVPAALYDNDKSIQPGCVFALEFLEKDSGRVLHLVLLAQDAEQRDEWITFLSRRTPLCVSGQEARALLSGLVSSPNILFLDDDGETPTLQHPPVRTRSESLMKKRPQRLLIANPNDV